MTWAESFHGRLRAMAGDDEVLLMVGARCLLRDDQGRVLLIKRSDNGLWAPPAGCLELGDSLRDCAVREVQEETGLTPTALAPIAVLTGAGTTRTNEWGHTYQLHTTVFVVTEWTGELQTSTEETTDARWFHTFELPQPRTPSVEATLALLEQYERTGQVAVP